MSTSVTTVHAAKRDGQGGVYIGRPSKWGNPFAITKRHPREKVIELYREWILHQPELLSALPELRGKRLLCYCKPLPCHGDVLAELADGPLGE